MLLSPSQTFVSLKLDRGISIFEVAWTVQDTNVTLSQLSQVVDETRQVRCFCSTFEISVSLTFPTYVVVCLHRGQIRYTSMNLC